MLLNALFTMVDSASGLLYFTLAYLRNAEMTLEDDYDQIDGIVNNGRNPALAEKPQEKKPEVKKTSLSAG